MGFSLRAQRWTTNRVKEGRIITFFAPHCEDRLQLGRRQDRILTISQGDYTLESSAPKTTLLLILDGFGCGDSSDPSNAIALAKTPTWDGLQQRRPYIEIGCSGASVGLPDMQMGNSEVGHLHIGGGRMLPQDFTRINDAIDDGSFFENPALCEVVDQAISNGRALHILGLLSPGGVHSHQCQIGAMIELAVKRGLSKVYLHAFLDGRDTPPRSAAEPIDAMEKLFAGLGGGRVASIIGRFYAMDRDSNWDRIESAYNLLVSGTAENSSESASGALQQAYGRDENDEFVSATTIVPAGMSPVTIEDGDSVVFMNFRTDRTRELSIALNDADFDHFERSKVAEIASFVTLTQYHEAFDFPVAFAPIKIKNCFGEWLSSRGLKQLRIAETEKYAHVTFFLNGGTDKPFEGEDRILIPSPKVKTYDMQPEMSAVEVTDRLVEAIEGGQYDAIVCNYANCDMVGHTGGLAVAITAVETIDRALKRITEALDSVGGEMLLTADHGNADRMVDPVTGQPHTAHTTNPVPLLYFGQRSARLQGPGSLVDIAPTVLDIMGLDLPAEMSGHSLLQFGE